MFRADGVGDLGGSAEGNDLAGLSIDELAARGRTLAAQVAQLQAEQVAVVAELQRRSRQVHGTVPAFVAWQFGLQRGEANRLVALARRLPSVPKLGAAFADGELSEATTRLLLGVATPDNEAKLLATARDATASQLATLVHEYRRVRDTPADGVSDDDDRSGRPSEWRSWWDHDRLLGRFDLDATDGLALEQALGLARAQVRAACDPDASAGDPIADADGSVPAGLLPDEVRPVSEARALAALVGAYVAGNLTEAELVPDGHHTLIITNDEALREHATRGPTDHGGGEEREPDGRRSFADVETSYVPGGPVVPTWMAVANACQGSVSALLEKLGLPINATVDARFANRAQRRALMRRDRCCTFPGCGATTRLVAHHVVEYPHGPTALANLILLCVHHHNLIHRARYRVRVAPDGGRPRFARADGTPVPSCPRRPTPADLPDPPAPGARHTGTHEPLTEFGADVILHDWLQPCERTMAGPTEF
jgi:hypothetical protein